MGVLADLFVATAEAAVEYEASLKDREAHLRRYQPAEHKGITQLDVEALWSLVLDEPWDPDVHALDPVEIAGDGETWLFRFPQAFLDLLTTLEPSRLDALSEAWAETEELAASGFDAAETRRLIEDVTRLARKAKSEQRDLYLWGSL